MILGYARTTSDKDTNAVQLAALTAAGCSEIIKDKAETVGLRDLRGFQTVMGKLNKGDTLVIWRFDRVGRNLGHLVEILEKLASKGVTFQSISENINTADSSTVGGNLFSLVEAFTDFQKTSFSERAKVGRKVAAERGIKFGRKRSMSLEDATKAQTLLESGEHPDDVAKSFECSRSTLYRNIAVYKEQINKGEQHASAR